MSKDPVKMEVMEARIASIFATFKTSPVLFVGSGISRRYIGLENWEGLLSRYAQILCPDDPNYAFLSYRNQARERSCPQGEFAYIAELIEKDFNRLWISSSDFRSRHAHYEKEILAGNIQSPFKADIAASLLSRKQSFPLSGNLATEVEYLSKISHQNISGIITTNYDCFLESIFKFQKYVGQRDLLFSTTLGIAEIYKIHGCCTQPDSIVITEKDYDKFDKKAAYLAAKILTTFLEYPVVFLGYNIGDSNIIKILTEISNCLDEQQLKILQNRLVFVRYCHPDEKPSIREREKELPNMKSLLLTQITLNDYTPLYKAIFSNKTKYNPRILRQLKNDVYELVKTCRPTTKMKVIDIENARLDEVEIVVGVGLLENFGEKGFIPLSAADIFEDVVLDNLQSQYPTLTYDRLLRFFPKLSKGARWPIHKYLHCCSEIPADLLPKKEETYDQLLNSNYRKGRKSPLPPFPRIFQMEKNEDVVYLLPYYSQRELGENLTSLEQFLRKIFHQGNVWERWKGNALSNLKRVIRLYDWLKYH